MSPQEILAEIAEKYQCKCDKLCGTKMAKRLIAALEKCMEQRNSATEFDTGENEVKRIIKKYDEEITAILSGEK